MNRCLFFLFILSFCGLYDSLISQPILDTLDIRHDVTYAKYGERTLEMDIYRFGKEKKILPGIICIHGGGWAKGTRASHSEIAQALAARGYVTATISYRLSGEAPFPAAIQDCKAAVRFFRAQASELGIDPNKIGAIGSSAGGHLTALLATSNGSRKLEGDGGNPEFSSRIQAAVPMGAQTDFLSERTRQISRERLIWKQFMNGSLEDRPEAYGLASPLEHLDKSDPPCLIICGEMDDESTRAEEFRARMKSLNIPSALKVISGAPHGFLRNKVWFDQVIEAADSHFNRVLKRS